MKFDRIFGMASRHTFTIKPISDLLDQEMGSGFMVKGLWCDPFAGENSCAQETNDLNPKKPTKHHMDALEFLKTFPDNHFDGILFDPPYSPRQVKECYEGFGRKVTQEDTQRIVQLRCKNEIVRILKPGGKVICCGWNSMDIGKTRGFEMQRILLVPHGGTKNDTIVTVEVKL